MTSLTCESYRAPILSDYKEVGFMTFRPLTGRVCKIGYEVFEQFRQRGHATNAVRQSVDVLLKWGFCTFLTGVRSDNKWSQIVLFRNGFRVDYLTRESDGIYLQCRYEKSWNETARDAYWLPNV